MGNCAHSMKQHSYELYEDDSKEEKYQDYTNRFQMEVLFCNDDLDMSKIIGGVNDKKKSWFHNCFRYLIFVNLVIQGYLFKCSNALI